VQRPESVPRERVSKWIRQQTTRLSRQNHSMMQVELTALLLMHNCPSQAASASTNWHSTITANLTTAINVMDYIAQTLTRTFIVVNINNYLLGKNIWDQMPNTTHSRSVHKKGHILGVNRAVQCNVQKKCGEKQPN